MYANEIKQKGWSISNVNIRNDPSPKSDYSYTMTPFLYPNPI